MKRIVFAVSFVLSLVPVAAFARTHTHKTQSVTSTAAAVGTDIVAAANAAVATTPVQLGFSVHSLNSAQAAGMKTVGATWVRDDFDWGSIEPTPGKWNWYMDPTVKTASASGLKVLGIIDYSAPWAGCSGNCLPNDPTQYAAYAKALAQHYAPLGVHAWEIWNEENTSTYKGRVDAAHYTLMLQLAYKAIKSVDPSATIIIGGLSPASTDATDMSPTDFLSAVYNNGGQGYFDGVGMHPYSWPTVPSDYEIWNAWSQVAQTPTSLESIMKKYGDTSKKIWLTEFGAPTGGTGGMTTCTSALFGWPAHVDQCQQAKIMTDAITTVKNSSWAGPLFLYEYQDEGTGSNIEDYFGITTASGAQKLAYTAIKTAMGK